MGGDDSILEPEPETVIITSSEDLPRDYVDLVSTDLVYSSTQDNIRKAIGSCFNLTKPLNSVNEGNFEIRQQPVRFEDDLRGLEIAYAPCSSSHIYKIEPNPALMSPIDSSLHIPNVKIPFRMYADTDNINGDLYWREFVAGGNYAGINYESMIDTSNIYYDIAISFKMPIKYKTLRAYEILNITPESETLTCELKANYLDYNLLVHNYQNWSSNLSSELLIPNYYVNSMKLYEDNEVDLEDPTTIKNMQMGFTKEKQNVFSYHFDTGVQYDLTEKDQYYGSHFINTTQKEEYKNAALTQQQNILFDHGYFKWLSDKASPTLERVLARTGLNLNEKLSTFYNIQLDFERHTHANFGDPIESSALFRGTVQDLEIDQKSLNPNFNFHMIFQEFSSKFLEMLKDLDEGNLAEVPMRMQPFMFSHRYEDFLDSAGGPVSIKEINESVNAPINLKTVNLLQFLTYAFNNYDAALNYNYLFAGPSDASHAATMATDTLFRNRNSQQLLHALDLSYDLINYYFHVLTQGSTGGDEQLNQYGITELSEDIIRKIINPTKKFYEVIAYKVEKVNNDQEVIQKFWIYNSPDAPNKLSIIDSQVKYNKNYTYKISAYTLVISHKYKYADFRLSKQIGTGQKYDETDATETPKFCLQFYDPVTEQVADQLFTTANSDEDSVIAAFKSSALSEANELASSNVDISEHPQVADFHLMVEPCFELIEIPFYSKTVKVMDSPPNAINIIPFHFIDNSNRIGFKIGQDSYIDRVYPINITADDVLQKLEYLNSREMLSVQKLTEPSQSPARYVQMFRIKEKPNAFTDFAHALVATVDLRQPDSVHNCHDYITADKIIPNKKYYYLFRLLNENMIPGPVSQIIECELVNDGGYIYSLFEAVDSSEFSPNKITTNSKVVKKIMQLEPHINQMMFNTKDMNFDNYAFEEIGNLKVGVAEQEIWNRKFKIRLTSKKTGKKIDLNTTFNLRDRDLTKLSDTMVPPTSEGPTEETLPPIPPAPAEAVPITEESELPPSPPSKGAGRPADHDPETRYKLTLSQMRHVTGPDSKIFKSYIDLVMSTEGLPFLGRESPKTVIRFIESIASIIFKYRSGSPDTLKTKITFNDAVIMILGFTGNAKHWEDTIYEDSMSKVGLIGLLNSRLVMEVVESKFTASKW
tara:strand:- start:7049 stop:10519 length:3471 start_codon:yes stop_codon:yes gene_type:complete